MIPKRLILLCDGTGNSATRSNELSTNVKRLCDLVAREYKLSACRTREHPKDPVKKTCTVCEKDELIDGEQIVFYQSGVGTGTKMGDLYTTYAKGTGAGINDNILDAYHFLATNYVRGDEIFIFGFSRGAYTARIVANLVIQLGLFYKNNLWMMRKAWEQYSKDDGGENFRYFVRELWELDYKKTRPVTIKVLGVWDTVGAVGVPDYLSWMNSQDFHNPTMLSGIEHVFHALALDEYRRTFGPTLFYLPSTTRPRRYKNRKGELYKFPDKTPVLKQCWFPGAHSNVGGSYPSEHIADITLAWMVDQIVAHGDLIEFDPYAIWRLVDRHLNPAKNLNTLYKTDSGDYPGWGAGTVYDSYNALRTYLTWQYRAPGNYTPNNHPGAASVGQLPSISIPISLPSVNLSKLDPRQLWKKPTEYDNLKVELAVPPAGPPLYTLPESDPESSKYCQEPQCCHPSRLGRYEREKEDPIFIPRSEGSTCETIHGSVFARFLAKQEASKIKNYRTEEAARQNFKTNLYPNNNEKVLTVSLLDWNPGALDAFKDPAAGKTPRYRRETLPSGATVWIGTCFRTKKLFEILEEPDRCFSDETWARLSPGLKEVLRVGSLTRMMNQTSYRALPNPFPKKSDVSTPGPDGQPWKPFKWTKEAWVQQLYIDEKFDIKEITSAREKKEKEYEHWKNDPKAKKSGWVPDE